MIASEVISFSIRLYLKDKHLHPFWNKSKLDSTLVSQGNNASNAFTKTDAN